MLNYICVTLYENYTHTCPTSKLLMALDLEPFTGSETPNPRVHSPYMQRHRCIQTTFSLSQSSLSSTTALIHNPHPKSPIPKPFHEQLDQFFFQDIHAAGN